MNPTGRSQGMPAICSRIQSMYGEEEESPVHDTHVFPCAVVVVVGWPGYFQSHQSPPTIMMPPQNFAQRE